MSLYGTMRHFVPLLAKKSLLSRKKAQKKEIVENYFLFKIAGYNIGFRKEEDSGLGC